MQETISANANKLAQLYRRVKEEFAKKPHGEKHRAACEEFHRDYDLLAFPGGLRAGLKRMKECDSEIVEMSIVFLEVDPMFFGSGYIKEAILRRLKRCLLNEDQRVRLIKIIVRSMDAGGRREFRGYSRLAAVIHSNLLAREVKARLNSSKAEVVRRANAIQHIWRTSHIHYGIADDDIPPQC